MKFTYPEGATPIEDISGLKLKWVQTQEDLNQAEAENIYQATRKYLLKPVSTVEKWFHVPFLKEVHQEMFSLVWDWAGSFRTHRTIPGIEPYQIPEALHNLCEDVRFWSNLDDNTLYIEQAAIIHHRLVFIHPFSNGNGRFSRVIADRFLKSKGCKIPIWPVDISEGSERRKQYIQSLRSADKGDLIPLQKYMIECGASIKE
ncbi:MAG: mobile mystery protein B [Chlamydiia bacterium]|nr:mobile mystery protein B [Chlamydiia bacterium]